MSEASKHDVKPEPKEPVDDLVVTHHTLRTTGGEISYTARTGRIVLREEEIDKKQVFKGWKARAERGAWAAHEVHGDVMNKLAITYLNRLSDLVFILARYANRTEGDVLWVPGGERGE